MINATLKKLYFSPVKSLSFSNTESLIIKKNVGIKNDRIFAFTRIINEIEYLAFRAQKKILQIPQLLNIIESKVQI